MSKFFKDLVSVAFSKAGVILFGLGKAVILSRWLGPEQTGIITALNVFPMLFMSIGSLGVRQSTTYLVGQKQYDETAIKTALVHIWVISTVFSMLSCFLLMKNMSSAGHNTWLVLLAMAPIPFNLFNTYNSGIFLGQNNIRTFNRINWLPSFVILLLTALLVVFLNMGITGGMMAAIGGPLVMSAILLFKNRFIKSFSFTIEWKVVKSLLSLGIVYAVSLLVINLNYRIDIFLMDRLSTAHELGIYSRGAQLMEYLWEIPMLLSTLVFSGSATAANGRAYSEKVAPLLRISILVVGVLSLILFMYSEQIITLLFGEAFQRSAKVQQILLPGVLLLTVFKVLNMDLAGKGKPWIAIKAMIPALVLNIVLNLLWIPTHGAAGSALASTISYSVAAIIFLFLYARAVDMEVKQIITYKKEDYRLLTRLFTKKLNKLPT